MAGSRTQSLEGARRVKQRARILAHYAVTKNVSATCRYFGISRTTFYIWQRRYHAHGTVGLADRPRRPNMIRYQIPPEVVALVGEIRRDRGYGAPRLSQYLQRYHQVYVSSTTILKLFKRHGLAERTWKGVRRPPKQHPPAKTPGESLQVDVKFVPKRLTGTRRFYQFTAIDEATRFRVLRVYDHNTTANARAFLDEVRRVLPVAIHRVQTDHGSEFGWDFTWHLRDVGIQHRRIPRGHPQSNGKVERSHRTDSEEFYRRIHETSLRELAAQLAAWEREYNFGRPHMALAGRTPAEALHDQLAEPTTKSVQDVS